MEIKLLRRDQIDDAQWNTRVEKSSGLPYAFTGYLDIVNKGNWRALVSENYQSIFPLPIERKLGLVMYLQPPFTQQLGLISEDHSLELLSTFMDAIPNDAASIFLKGNENNLLRNHATIQINERSNYLLDLERDYEEIHSNFSKSLRKRIRKGKAFYDVEISTDVDRLVDFYQQEMQSRVGLNEGQYQTAKRLFKYLIEEGSGKIYHARNASYIDGALFVIQHQNRIINLFGTSNANGKKEFAMQVILDHIIEQNASTKMILDFEGSDLKGVKEFYESFGPERVTYPEFINESLPFWYSMLKKWKST